MIVFEWYRSFLQFLLNSGASTWFAKLVAYGELLIGIALVLGAFVGIAAFFGGLMNWNFIWPELPLRILSCSRRPFL